jgi:hypothetical protein
MISASGAQSRRSLVKHTKREEGHYGKKERGKKEKRSGKEKSEKEGAKGQSQEKRQKETKEEGEKITEKMPDRQKPQRAIRPATLDCLFFTYVASIQYNQYRVSCVGSSKRT